MILGMLALRAASLLIAAFLLLNEAAAVVGARLASGGEIVFMSDRDSSEDIYLMDYGRSLFQNLTHNPATDRFPLWSPDGRWIAFTSDRDGYWNIYVMDASGHSVRRLSDNRGHYRYAAWSPDAQQVVYSSSEFDGGRLVSSSIFVANISGDTPRSLTHTDGRMVYAPVWSSDGSRIRFNIQMLNRATTYHMKNDGSDWQMSSDDDAITWLTPRLLPRAAQLRFTTYVTMRSVDICVVDLAKTLRRCVTEGVGRNLDPMWRPTGG
jgi:Tol biopolymer transport system component